MQCQEQEQTKVGGWRRDPVLQSRLLLTTGFILLDPLVSFMLELPDSFLL